MDDKWDRRFLAVAELVSTWSKDPSTKLGCVLVRDRRIVATGYNGFPAPIADDERLHVRDTKYKYVVHGEMNAVLQAGLEARGTTLYLHSPNGGPPCERCCPHLITVGVERVVYWNAPENPRWPQATSLAMLNEARVGITVITR